MSGGPNFATFCVSNSSVQDVWEMQSIQEEADTKINLHTKAAANQEAQRLVVCAPDTDVFVLLLHHVPSLGIEEVFFFTGREGKHTHMLETIHIHTPTMQDFLNWATQHYSVSILAHWVWYSQQLLWAWEACCIQAPLSKSKQIQRPFKFGRLWESPTWNITRKASSYWQQFCMPFALYMGVIAYLKRSHNTKSSTPTNRACRFPELQYKLPWTNYDDSGCCSTRVAKWLGLWMYSQ